MIKKIAFYSGVLGLSSVLLIGCSSSSDDSKNVYVNGRGPAPAAKKAAAVKPGPAPAAKKAAAVKPGPAPAAKKAAAKPAPADAAKPGTPDPKKPAPAK